MRLHHLTGLVEFSRRLAALGASQDFINALAGQLEESKPLVAPVPEGFNQDVFDAVKQLESIPFEPGERKQAAAKLRTLLDPAASRIHVLVFVHGIFSTAVAAFREMFEHFVAANAHWCALFDYDFTREITSNGKFLAERLEDLNDRCDVTLICHSMGGLVARLMVTDSNLTDHSAHQNKEGIEEVHRILLLNLRQPP